MSTFPTLQCISLLSILVVVQSSRILLLPYPWKSHVSEMTGIGHALIERGHDIHIVLPPSYPDFHKFNTSTSPFHLIDYVVKKPDFQTIFAGDQGFTEDVIKSLMGMTVIEDMRINVEGLIEMCSNILSDDVLFTKLESLEFDLVVVDVCICCRCHLAIPYRLGVPHVSLTTIYEPWLSRSPAIPSFVPFMLAQYFTERMTFMERLQNTYQLLEWTYSPGVSYLTDEFMRPFIPDKPYRSLNQLAADSKLWLLDTDFVIDYARPTMPNEVNIGGLSTKPSTALPNDLQELMDSAVDGVVIMSFGSFMDIPVSLLQKFFVAFEQLEQTVVMRSALFSDQLRVPRNVKILKWLPQNDLLGHPNTRLFITHCGTNGQFEALYHGVPMLGFPIFADQPYNALRVEYHGFGRHMDLLDFTTEALLDNINGILSNESYRNNINKASEIFRCRPLAPRERAAYWVEQVLHHGTDHLRSHALDMEWYEYLMVDILALILIPVLIIILLSCGLICHCWHKANSSGNRKSKSD